MISVIKIEYLGEYTLKLYFSDDTVGELDFEYLCDVKSSLTHALQSKEYFKSCFIDFGALCWKNGLELSAESLQLKCKASHSLHVNKASA